MLPTQRGKGHLRAFMRREPKALIGSNEKVTYVDKSLTVGERADMGFNISVHYITSSSVHLAGSLRATAKAFTAPLSILYGLCSNWEQFH